MESRLFKKSLFWSW